MVVDDLLHSISSQTALDDARRDVGKVLVKGSMCVIFGYTAYKLGRATISQQLPEPRRYAINKIKKAIGAIIN